jgi:hypothetical protein
MNILNQDLYVGYKNACIAAFRLLRSIYGDKASYVLKKKNKFHKNGTYSTVFIKQRDLSPKLSLQYSKIEELPEIRELIEYFAKDKRIEILRKYDAIPVAFIPGAALHSFLSRLVGKTLSFRFSLEEFEDLYGIFEEYLYLDRIHFRSFCLLRNFNSDMKCISLLGGLRIRRISNKERKKVIESPRVDDHLFFSSKWIIEFSIKVRREDGFPHAQAHELFSDLITALRLYKEGIIGYSNVYTYPLSSWDTTTYGSISNKYYSGKTYELNKSELFGFKKLWKKYSSLKSSGILKKRPETEIALTRLNFAYERERLEDKLIDYVIAFEALLLTGDSEKRYRCALMAALLIGSVIQNAEEKGNYMKKVRTYMSQAYKTRSDVVHGSRRLPKDLKFANNTVAIGDFIDEIGCYLRSAIKNYLDRVKNNNKRQVLEELEDSIFDLQG